MDEFARLDMELNKVYKKLFETISSSGKALLTKAQRSWIAFKEAEAKVYKEKDAKTKCLVALTQKRIENLKALQEYYTVNLPGAIVGSSARKEADQHLNASYSATKPHNAAQEQAQRAWLVWRDKEETLSIWFEKVRPGRHIASMVFGYLYWDRIESLDQWKTLPK